MIDEINIGKKICNLPDELFCCGFDNPELADQRYPSLVIASLDSVPQNANDWFLASQDCGGFSCDGEEAAILPLTINSDYGVSLSKIVDEQFSSLEGLDYYCAFKPSEKELTQQEYINALSSIGLTCSKPLAKRYLTQALYPLNLTSDNLSKLTTDKIDLNTFEGIEGLVLFVVGENCD